MVWVSIDAGAVGDLQYLQEGTVSGVSALLSTYPVQSSSGGVSPSHSSSVISSLSTRLS